MMFAQARLIRCGRCGSGGWWIPVRAGARAPPRAPGGAPPPAHSFEWVTDVAIGEAGEIVLLALPGLTHSCHVLDMSNVTSPQ